MSENWQIALVTAIIVIIAAFIGRSKRITIDRSDSRRPNEPWAERAEGTMKRLAIGVFLALGALLVLLQLIGQR